MIVTVHFLNIKKNLICSNIIYLQKKKKYRNTGNIQLRSPFSEATPLNSSLFLVFTPNPHLCISWHTGLLGVCHSLITLATLTLS